MWFHIPIFDLIKCSIRLATKKTDPIVFDVFLHRPIESAKQREKYYGNDNGVVSSSGGNLKTDPLIVVDGVLVVDGDSHGEIGIILGVGFANERRCCSVTLSVIAWAHTQNDPCKASISLQDASI